MTGSDDRSQWPLHQSGGGHSADRGVPAQAPAGWKMKLHVNEWYSHDFVLPAGVGK